MLWSFEFQKRLSGLPLFLALSFSPKRSSALFCARLLRQGLVYLCIYRPLYPFLLFLQIFFLPKTASPRSNHARTWAVSALCFFPKPRLFSPLENAFAALYMDKIIVLLNKALKPARPFWHYIHHNTCSPFSRNFWKDRFWVRIRFGFKWKVISFVLISHTGKGFLGLTLLLYLPRSRCFSPRFGKLFTLTVIIWVLKCLLSL